MRPELGRLLACARCGGNFAIEGEEAGGELHEGILRCESCDAVVCVTAGIPRAAGASPAHTDVAEVFSSQWSAYERGEFGLETLYGPNDASLWKSFLDSTGISEQGVAGLTVLDAGCGPARIGRLVAQHGARTVVALDLTDVVDFVNADARDLINLHTLQADLSAAPLRSAFDLVWSMGVIHHTSDAAEAFRALTRYVRPGGLLFVWVYPRDLSPFHVANLLPRIHAPLRRLGLWRRPRLRIRNLAKFLSYPTVALHLLYRAARSLPGLRPRDPIDRENIQPVTRQAFYLLWNDLLLPPYTSLHREREVVGWFQDAGFTDIVTARTPRLGVRGRAPVE